LDISLFFFVSYSVLVEEVVVLVVLAPLVALPQHPVVVQQLLPQHALLQLPPLPLQCSHPAAVACFRGLVLPLPKVWPLVLEVRLPTVLSELLRVPCREEEKENNYNLWKLLEIINSSSNNSFKEVVPATSKCSLNVCKSTRGTSKLAPSCTRIFSSANVNLPICNSVEQLINMDCDNWNMSIHSFIVPACQSACLL
jgi:hypothetical protein